MRRYIIRFFSHELKIICPLNYPWETNTTQRIILYQDFRFFLINPAIIQRMNKKELGKFGESHAESYLNSLSYQILHTNYYSRFGEIDIIAIDYSITPPQLAFIEVKTRSTTSFGLPLESITNRKKQRLRKTALNFLNSSTQKIPRRWRIDVIGIQLDSNYKFQNLTHIKNI